MSYAAEVVAFFVGAGFAGWWFAVTILPIMYGLPRAVSMVLRGRARWAGCAWCLGAPIIWSVVFTITAVTLGIFFPWMIDFAWHSEGFLIGQWVGVGWSVLYCLSAAGRRDLNGDFMDNMARFLTPRGRAELEAYQVVQRAGTAVTS